jgi:hypothetical protein
MQIMVRGVSVETELLRKLGSKEISKAQLLSKVQLDFDLLPELLQGTSSSKASVRYGCGKVLMDLSEKYPEKLYSYMDNFIELLNSKRRILTWNAIAIIANLTRVDKDRKFDAIFDRYYGFLCDEYMVTVANVVCNSIKIVLAKPYLVQRITAQLLRVQDLKATPHLTEQCKLVIAQHAIKTFDAFFKRIEVKEQVLAFVQKYLNSSRTALREEAEIFLKKWQPLRFEHKSNNEKLLVSR